MQIFVKLLEGKTVAIDVEPTSTAEDLQQRIAEKAKDAHLALDWERQYLSFNGQPLERGRTLADYQIEDDSTVQLNNKARGGSKKGKCCFAGCIKRAVLITGDCRHCQKQFCGNHRLPENHACQGIESCRQAAFDKNKNKLLSEKCVSQKINF